MGETEGVCRGNCLQVHAQGSFKAHQSHCLFQLWVYALITNQLLDRHTTKPTTSAGKEVQTQRTGITGV